MAEWWWCEKIQFGIFEKQTAAASDLEKNKKMSEQSCRYCGEFHKVEWKPVWNEEKQMEEEQLRWPKGFVCPEWLRLKREKTRQERLNKETARKNYVVREERIVQHKIVRYFKKQ